MMAAKQPVSVMQEVHIGTRALVLLFAVVCMELAPLDCRADIHTYNEAVKRGDYQSAAEQTREIWRTFDKRSPQTATVAREFGFIDYVAGRFKDAHTFGTFLVRQGAKLDTPDDEPATSAALLAAADFRLHPGRGERMRLYRALERRQSAPGVDNITVIAADLLYNYDWQRPAWHDAAQSASLAAALFARGGAPLLVQTRRAKVTAIAATFFVTKKPDTYTAMISLYNQLVSDINAGAAATQAPTLESLRWQAMAWVYAMETWFQSYYQQVGSHVNLDIKPGDLKKTTTELNKRHPHYTKPHCAGHLYHKSLRFPLRPAYKGMVGAVIMRANFDSRGYLVDQVILASAPSVDFNKEVLKDSRRFHWQVDQGVDIGTCRLEDDDVIIPVEFEFD